MSLVGTHTTACGGARLGYILGVRSLLAMPVLAHAFAFLPLVAVGVIQRLIPDWGAVADAAGKMVPAPLMCPEPSASPFWVQAFVKASPLYMQQPVTNILLSHILPPLMQVMLPRVGVQALAIHDSGDTFLFVCFFFLFFFCLFFFFSLFKDAGARVSPDMPSLFVYCPM
jgi:hypothetical protein